MLTVNELATQCKAPPHVVRYYARIGLILPAGQPENSRRLCKPQDVARIPFIHIAERLGFTLNEIKRITRHADWGYPPVKMCARSSSIASRNTSSRSIGS